MTSHAKIPQSSPLHSFKNGEGPGVRDIFSQHETLFDTKPLLKRIYNEDFFRRIFLHSKNGGPTVEIGSGPGLLKRYWPEIIATDVKPRANLNATLDACKLPFRSNSIENVVGLDVLHHLPSPLAFLNEAERVLRPHGRLVFIEPWVTPVSRFIYRHFHHEACDETANPFSASPDWTAVKDPMDGNQALPFLLFGPGVEETLSRFPSLKLIRLEPFSGALYLLSLGFRPGTLAPGWVYPWLQSLEEWTGPVWKPWGALRALIVLEKIE